MTSPCLEPDGKVLVNRSGYDHTRVALRGPTENHLVRRFGVGDSRTF